ncbi:hypothetical protein J2Z60_001571 [Lactobacillus colini]|uniref:DUF4145 domain-containing protein n=1 Tax=Lactobacillus colini TaxID=1819254 RepID=A0ABS4MFC0_9LACO|nr:DUF4145 domain-containing protein [Lactobacillus colini]MBP2058392.1 hypothetical protein [Lactobacillus colini]
MKSNFEFLNQDEMTSQYYARANEAEKAYVFNAYASVLTSVRATAENIATDVADQNFINIDNLTFNEVLKKLKLGAYIDDYALQLFYDIKGAGNVAAHSLEETTNQEALKALKQLYALAVWFVRAYYDEKMDATKSRRRKNSFTRQQPLFLVPQKGT